MCLTDMLAVGGVTWQAVWAAAGIASAVIESNHAYFSKRPLPGPIMVA